MLFSKRSVVEDTFVKVLFFNHKQNTISTKNPNTQCHKNTHSHSTTSLKKVFGVEENKDILMSLINAIVDKSDQVEEIELLNPYEHMM